MALQQTNHLCQQLQIAIKLFINNEFNPCLIHINYYLDQNIANVNAYDIKGTCQLKLNLLQEALKTYQIAKQIDPNNLGIINNTAYILIQLGKYEEALAILQKLQENWHHPSVYLNLKKVFKLMNKEELSTAAQQKTQNSKIIYPKIHVFQDGLIYNFLLDPKTTIVRSKILENDLIKKISQIHKEPISSKSFKNIIDELKEIVQELRNLQFKYGIIRPKHIGLISSLVQSYKKIMNKIWLDIDLPLEKQIYQHYHKQINQISNKVQHIFWSHYKDIKQENSLQQNQKIKTNFNQELLPLNQSSQKIQQLINRDRSFLSQQNDSKKVKTPKCRQFNYIIKKDFSQFQQKYQQFKIKHEYCITFQKGQVDPFFVIIKPIKDVANQQTSFQQNQDDLIVYLNIRKCLQRFDMTSQCRQIISKIGDEEKVKKMKYFYWIITFLSKIYSWYRQGSLQITKTTQKAKSKYYLSITELIEIVYPLLEQIPKDQVQGIGHMIRTLHYSLLMFLAQCRNGPGDSLRNVIIQNIAKCLTKNENEICKTLTQICSKQNFINLVLNLQKSIQSDYLSWRIQLNLPNEYQNQQNCIVLVNCLSILINFGYLQEETQEKYLFMTSFVNTFIKTTRKSGRTNVVEEFYYKHHSESLLKKGVKLLRWIFV